jgi:hypothetical protein
MRERNQKHGHKRSEHPHGGKSMGKPNKRRRIAKRNRAKKIESIAQLGRLAQERAALATAEPFSDTRPTLPSALFHESTPATSRCSSRWRNSRQWLRATRRLSQRAQHSATLD